MKNPPPAIQPAPPPPVKIEPINVPLVSTLHEKDGNEAVLDTLLKLTKQQPGFGYNRDNWRSWWAAEKASRDLQSRRADKPISQQSSAERFSARQAPVQPTAGP